ncbi:BufA2 family periplasmic bufferin-type metallophore [Chitinimonas naiadis]
MKFSSLALAAAAAAAFSASPLVMAATSGGDAKIKCEGINSCKGTSSCKTAEHACKGQNACKGHGWVEASAKECKAKGGKELKE